MSEVNLLLSAQLELTHIMHKVLAAFAESPERGLIQLSQIRRRLCMSRSNPLYSMLSRMDTSVGMHLV